MGLPLGRVNRGNLSMAASWHPLYHPCDPKTSQIHRSTRKSRL